MIYSSKPPRRIVSKKAYVRNLYRKASAASTGMGLLAISLLALVMAIFLLVAMVSSIVAHIVPLWLSLLLLACTGLLGGGGIFILHLGRRAIREAKQMQAGVPLTRANIGDLPVPESLVRASSEPVQSLQAVLLRAATGTDTTSSEHLVRAYQEPILEKQSGLLHQEPQTPVTIPASAETELVEQKLGAISFK